MHGSVEPRRSSIIGEVDSEPRSSPPREALSGWRFCCGETPSGLDRVCAVVLHSGLGRCAALGRTWLGLVVRVRARVRVRVRVSWAARVKAAAPWC